MNLELSEEQTAVRQLARDFVEREIAPHVIAWDRAENVDRSIVKKLGEVGFLGLTVDEEYGGSGGDHLAYCLVTEELGRGDSSVRGIVSVSLGLVAKTIAAWGDENHKRRWLPGLTAGEYVGCFGLTEPGTGSDAGNLATRAVRDGAGGYVINGTKMFITNGTWADVVLLFARSTDAPGHKGISAFLVPTDTPGLTRRPIHGKLGLRGQATAELVLQDVRVPASAMLGPEGKGFTVAMSALAKGRMSVAAGCVGIAQAALDVAVRYAGEREQFGRTIAHHQLVQELLSDIAVDVDAARLLTWRAARMRDAGQPINSPSSMAKWYASDVAMRVTTDAVQIYGGAGYSRDNPVERLMRDAKGAQIYEGTNQIHRLIVAQGLLDGARREG